LDATMFNGLLCAVGVEEGCNGVRDAQGRVNGKQFFYRSPRQRWNNAAVTAPAILDQILPIPAAARDEAIALKLRANFPLHLEAVRVFLRIMQRNPDLSIERFPPGSLPTLNIDSVDLRSSENPFALHARAQTIYSRQKWNPFYRLLAEGPTKATRKQLLLLCPTMDVQPSEPVKRTAWVWRWETDKVNERPYTMGGGWDCVFAGMLYNKMRVEDDVRKRLFQLFDELSDPADRLLSQVNADLSKALALADKLEHHNASRKSSTTPRRMRSRRPTDFAMRRNQAWQEYRIWHMQRKRRLPI
jgi:hypothetical protein